MAIARTVTKLPLSEWARMLGLHPLHFEQVRLPTTNNFGCSDIYFQNGYQTADHVSREDIAIAIAEAESKIEGALGYRLCPTWEVDEWHMTTRPHQSDLFNINSADIRGLKSTVQADWGWMISGGIKSTELIEAAAGITYSDPKSTGYDELATVVVATTVVDKNEIHVYYPGHAGDEAWEIRPIEVVIAAGNATITFKRELAVIEEKIETFETEDKEAIYDEDTDFLDEVDVYRVYNDPQTQVSFLWEPFANVCGVCGGSGCSTCAYTTQGGCLILRSNPRQSIVGFSPGTWDNDNDVFVSGTWSIGRMPEITRLYYYSGWRDKSAKYVSRMPERWGRAVAYYAASLLDRPPCECSANVWGKWRQDLTLISGDEDGRPYFREPGGERTSRGSGTGKTENPFGTTRGALNAWRMVSQNQIGPGQPLARAVSFA